MGRPKSKIVEPCKFCGNIIVARGKRGDIYTKKFCSNECTLAWRERERERKNHLGKVCEHCDSLFYKRDDELYSSFRKRKTCSIECAHNIIRVQYTHKCPICGTVFINKRQKDTCCSRQCSLKKRKKTIGVKYVKKRCPVCGGFFEILISREKKRPHKYCSDECCNNHKKICIRCGNEFVTRAGIGRVCKDCKKEDGTRAMFKVELWAWKSKVSKRDRHICRICFKKEKRMDAHHIYPYLEYPEKRYSIDNGITLCFKHHVLVHNKYKDGSLTPEKLFKLINDDLFRIND